MDCNPSSFSSRHVSTRRTPHAHVGAAPPVPSKRDAQRGRHIVVRHRRECNRHLYNASARPTGPAQTAAGFHHPRSTSGSRRIGVVHHARGPEGQPYVAKRAARNKANAEAYLHVEAAINSKLRVSAPGSAYLARSSVLPALAGSTTSYLQLARESSTLWTGTWTPKLHVKGSSHMLLALRLATMKASTLKRLAERLLKEMLSGLVLLHRPAWSTGTSNRKTGSSTRKRTPFGSLISVRHARSMTTLTCSKYPCR